MRKQIAVLYVLLLPGLAMSQTVTAPPKVEGQVRRLIRIPVTYDGKQLGWFQPAGECDIFREYTNDPAKVSLCFFAYKDGSYLLNLYTSKGDVLGQSTVEIVVGTPVPPTPPTPVPPVPPPDPTDALYLAIKAAWAQEVDPKKDEYRKTLADLYTQAVATADEASLKTVNDLLSVLRKASFALLGADSLAKVRTAAGGQLALVLPVDPLAPLTAEVRQKAKTNFAAVAKALEALR